MAEREEGGHRGSRGDPTMWEAARRKGAPTGLLQLLWLPGDRTLPWSRLAVPTLGLLLHLTLPAGAGL